MPQAAAIVEQIDKPEVTQEVTEEAKAPETPEVETKSEPEKAESGKKQVPVGALLEERKKWQARISEFEERLKKYDTLDQRLNQFYEEKNKAEQPKAPDWEQDPAGYLRFQQDQTQKRLDELNQQQGKYNQHIQQQEYVRNLGVQMAGIEQAFVKEAPDYYNALTFVRERQIEQYGLAGYSEAEAAQMLGLQEIQLINSLLQRKVNPAEYVYKIAQQYGYKKTDTGKDEKLSQIEEGLKASKTLGSGKASLEDFEKKNLSEFEQALAELGLPKR